MAKFEVGDKVVIDEAHVVPGYPNQPMTIKEVRDHCDRAGGHLGCEGVFIFEYPDGEVPGAWVHLASHRKADA
jgi:hypothetical protein